MSRFNQAALQLLQRASLDETPFPGETLDPSLKSPNGCFKKSKVLLSCPCSLAGSCRQHLSEGLRAAPSGRDGTGRLVAALSQLPTGPAAPLPSWLGDPEPYLQTAHLRGRGWVRCRITRKNTIP